MKQKERFDEKAQQEHTEPVHHRKAIIAQNSVGTPLAVVYSESEM